MQSNKPNVYVIVPVTITGMKKSRLKGIFQKVIQEKGFGFTSISIKQIRKECLEKFRGTDRTGDTEEQLKGHSSRASQKEFKQRLEELIKEAGKTHLPAHFVFLEKNHPPEAIESVLRTIRESAQGLNVQVIALASSNDSECITTTKHFYPFSANLFLTCFDEVQKRKEHETLVGRGVESAKVCLLFMNLFKNFRLDKFSLNKIGFDKVIYVSFVNEEHPTVIPKELTNALINTLQKSHKDFDDNKLQNLVNIHENLKLEFKEPELKTFEETINKFLQTEILPDVFPEEYPKNMEETKDPGSPMKLLSYEKNPQKQPIPLGIFPSKNSLLELKEYIISALKLLEVSFPRDQILKNTSEDLNKNCTSRLSFIEEPQVACFYIETNQEKLKTDCSNIFQPGVKVDIELVALVIVPEKLVIAICHPDHLLEVVEEGYPHLALMKGSWTLKSSLAILEALFGKGGSLNAEYNSKEFFGGSKLIKKILVKGPEGLGTAYVVKPDSHLVISGEARTSITPLY